LIQACSFLRIRFSHGSLIEQAVLLYLTHRAPLLKNRDDIERTLAQCLWAYKGRTLRDLANVAKAMTDHWTDQLSPATIRNRIRYLVAACRWAWKHKGLGEVDPGSRVTVPSVKNERHIYIDRSQMLRLAKACANKSVRAAVRIAFYSGLRLSEILTSERIQRDGVWYFQLEDSKNGQRHLVPIHPRVRCTVNVPMPAKVTLNRHFRSARVEAGMPELHFHDLRHSAASELINAGIDLYTVAKVLNHKSPLSTRRYAHLATSTIATAIDRIGRRRSI
jgi:integrase